MAKTLDEVGVKRLIQEIKGANKNLNTPIPISTENTTESMAQNVQNIADYIEKAKAAGIANVNGMGVTCLINNDYSGVGYLYSYEGGPIWVMGIITYDDTAMSPTAFFVSNEGRYDEREVVIKGMSDQVTSEMLVKGARKPIILTPSTTEVDEETYQKLLSDDVDVVFKDSDDEFLYLYDVDKNVSVNEIELRFVNTLGSVDTLDASDYWFSVILVDISKEAPHVVEIETGSSSLKDVFTHFNESIISPVLQEIYLTGTDADRKAKLDQFQTDWKALTGASDMEGARFVGLYTERDKECVGIFCYNATDVLFVSIALDDTKAYQVVLDPYSGQLKITPLFSHLEAITIYTDNTEENMQANLDNIAAYEANLQELGVDTEQHPMIPCVFFMENDYYTGFLMQGGKLYYNGYMHIEGYYLEGYLVNINDAGYVMQSKILASDYKSINAKSLEAIIIKTSNSTADKADNKAAIQAYVDNLKALGVDITKGYYIPVVFAESADYYRSGIMVYNSTSNTYNGYTSGTSGLPISAQIRNDGSVYLNDIQLSRSAVLSTTNKNIVGSINEVNTLAKGVKAFGAIELKASDNNSNKAAITAYLKILTDAGVSTTNGYSVPVRITGNSQEYHGMLNIGTGVLLSGIVTDVNENHHYPFNVSTTDGVITFDENNYFLEKGSNEVTEMLDAIKYSYTAVPFTDTALSNKAQLEVFLSKVPDATVMHCTYMEIWAGTLHKINGDWYGLLVKNTNSPADNINVKLSADGTIIKSNSAQ